MAKSGFDEIRVQLGAGEDIIVQPGAADDMLRIRIAGDRFPRIAFPLNPAGDVLVGNGASPPVTIQGSGGGGGGTANALPVYNVVTQYHADPLGVTDAASPINQAISDANVAGGGWVFVPDGTYSIASADVVMLAGVTLITESRDGVTFVDNRSSGSTIRIRGTNQTTPIERVHVQGVRITGSNPGTNGRKGIELQYARSCVVTECEVGNSGYGVWVYGSSSCKVFVRYTSCSSTDTSNKGAFHVVDDASGHSDSIDASGSTFSGCFERDVVVRGTGSNRPEAIDVSGCHMLGTHIRGRRVELVTTQGCRVTNNLFSTSAFDAGFSSLVSLVYVADAQGCLVFANQFTVSAAVATACIEIDATSLGSAAVTVQANKLTATAAISTAFVWWHNTAPHYNLVGTDIDNAASLNTASSAIHVGAPNTISQTQMWGPINAREYAIGDGVAYDGVALQAWLDACKASGRQGKWNAGTYLCQQDSMTPQLLVIDKGSGPAGTTLILGDGDGATKVVWNVALGLDRFDNPNSCFTPLNCGKSQSVELHGVAFQGPSGSSAATINPNNTPIPITTGFGPRVANRVHYEDISSRGFHSGLVVDGQINSGQFQALAKTNGASTVTVDVTISASPDASIIGMTIAGSGIPNGTVITGVGGNVITMSNPISNAGGLASLDLAVYDVGTPGSQRVQNTDHYVVANTIIETCRYGVYVRRNSGVQGGGNTGTADFTFRKLDIGRCQFAGIVASEDGYIRDTTFDFVHIANTAYSFLKEGKLGILPSETAFLTDSFFARLKSEGAGNYVAYCMSGLSVCQDWSGFFEINGGIEINGQKTHKFLNSSSNDHTWKPFTGSAVRDAFAGITVTCADSSVVQVGKMIAVESQNSSIGGHGGDATFVDCAIVNTIPDATHFTAFVGAQAKSVIPVAFGSGVSTISIAGNPNAKNQDIGDVVTGTGIAAGTFVGAVNFFAQTVDLVDASGNPISTNATNSGTALVFSLPAQATPANVRFGLIGAFRLGDVQDFNATFSVGSDPTSENISPEMYWDVNTIRRGRIQIVSSNANFPDIDVRSGNVFTATDTRFVRGDSEAFPAAAAATIAVGDPLVFASQGQVLATGAAETAPWAGFARQGAQPSVTTVALSAFAAVNGQAPFVVALRPWLMVQDRGPNYNAAVVDGGGVNCVDSTASTKYLVLSTATAKRVEALPSLATGRRVVAVSMATSVGTTGNQKVDADIVAHHVT